MTHQVIRSVVPTVVRVLVTALALSVVTTACVDDAPELSPDERRELEDYLLDEAPTPEHPLEIQFGDRLRLIGYDTSADEITPGEPFTVTWYWQVQRTVGGGWMLFTHIDDDGEGESVRNADGVGETVSSAPIRERYAANRWRGGEWIRDTEVLTLPREWSTDRAHFYIGFWRPDDENRLEVTSGPSDGTNRAEAATIPVHREAAAAVTGVVAPAPVSIPALRAPHVTGAIVTDGVLDEADWNQAPAASFVNTLDGTPASLQAAARMLWADQGLYVAFEVADTTLRATSTAHDDHLWEQDCIELMVDPDGDGLNYFEIQIAPNGLVFDTHYDSRRVPQPVGNLAWDAQITSVGVAPVGTLNDDAPDQRYTVEALIPWAAFSHGTMPAATAPAAGSTWRMNLYVMDLMASGSRSAGWSATLEGDFHVPARFGRVTFEAPPAPVVPAPSAVLGAGPGAGPGGARVAVDPDGNPIEIPAEFRRRLGAIDHPAAAVERAPGGLDAVRRPATGE
jgi:hypothetical protein